jgi:predicted nucleic acid-binding protein
LILLDTDIFIDYLRLHPAAILFIDSFSQTELSFSLFTYLELLQGCPNKIQEKRIGEFLKYFEGFPIDTKISSIAFMIYRENHLRFHLDIPDSFIAATAIVHNLLLVTRNEKHYKGIEGLKLQIPYSL